MTDGTEEKKQDTKAPAAKAKPEFEKDGYARVSTALQPQGSASYFNQHGDRSVSGRFSMSAPAFGQVTQVEAGLSFSDSRPYSSNLIDNVVSGNEVGILARSASIRTYGTFSNLATWNGAPVRSSQLSSQLGSSTASMAYVGPVVNINSNLVEEYETGKPVVRASLALSAGVAHTEINPESLRNAALEVRPSGSSSDIAPRRTQKTGFGGFAGGRVEYQNLDSDSRVQWGAGASADINFGARGTVAQLGADGTATFPMSRKSDGAKVKVNVGLTQSFTNIEHSTPEGGISNVRAQGFGPKVGAEVTIPIGRGGK